MSALRLRMNSPGIHLMLRVGGVVLATGGFGANAQMVQKIQSED